MNWPILAIPLIALAVYLLGSLLGGNKKEPPERLRRPAPPGERKGPPPARPPRSSTDLDRFLQEVQRRRQAAEQRANPPAEPEPTADAERSASPKQAIPAPAVSPVAPPTPPPPLPRLTRPVRSTPKKRPRQVAEETIPFVLPAEPAPPIRQRTAPPPLRAVAPETAPAATRAIVPGAEGLRAAPPLPDASGTVDETQAPAVAQLLSLLKAPTGLATAIMLREVLDKPLCMRGGRRR